MDKIITVDIGASKIKFQSLDKEGVLGSEKISEIINLDLDNEKLVQIIKDGVKSLIDNETDSKFLGMSIGVPGLVSREKGTIKILPNVKNIKNLDITEELKNSFGLPVYILNDADAGVLGEWKARKSNKLKDIIYITLSTGVGSGIIKNEQLEPFSELGHIPLSIPDEVRICSCGEQNHTESYLGTEGLAKIYANVFKIKFEELETKDRYLVSFNMRQGIDQNDSNWIKVLEEYSKNLALFLDQIIDKHSPELIILGGGIAYNNNILLEKTKEFITKKADIELAKFYNSVNLGLAEYAFKQIKS